MAKLLKAAPVSDRAEKARMRPHRSARLVGGMITAKICAMAGSAAFASTLVELARAWHLDSTRAGWISSAYLIGYALAVPILVSLTDRIDPRAIFLAGCAIGTVAFAGFALLARGVASAFLFQAMAGVSLAGIYMPGLRVLTQRLELRARIRAVPYYTGAFGIGTGLSFLISGWLSARYGWQATFAAGAAGTTLSAILMIWSAWGISIASDFDAAPSNRHPLDFRPVLRNRGTLPYIFAYGGHSWELFAFRAWLPTFLLFAWNHSAMTDAGFAISRWSTLIVLIGVPSSIVGAELATRWTRNRLIRWFEIASIAAGLLAPACGGFSFGLAVLAMFAYNAAITADSGALTASVVAITRPGEQGATLAVYSMIGFGGGAIGPLAVGAMLDLGGGFDVAHAWYLGFAAMVVGSALAAVAITLASASSEAWRTGAS
ncbi:MAG TPA: MFS transporter [Candidatus Binataceae bacterium]|nr:MFS transporter [Candidatus Binataceae bacterium]